MINAQDDKYELRETIRHLKTEQKEHRLALLESMRNDQWMNVEAYARLIHEIRGQIRRSEEEQEGL